ncbi:Dynein heavy chain 6, axonemal, partial [Kappamyces sp. JEL0680]
MGAAFSQIVKAEGMGALATGFGPTAVGYFVQGWFKFGGVEFFKVQSSKFFGERDAFKYRFPIYLGSAAAAEFIADIFLCPLEATRIRLVSNPTFASGLLSAMPKIIKTDGFVRGFYSGFGPILFKQIPYTMAKFAVQGWAAEKIYVSTGIDPVKSSEAAKLSVSLGSGVIAGVAAAIISHPADTLLSLINKQGAGGSGSISSRLFNLARETGFKKLCLTGLGPRCVMIGTLTAGQFVVFDYTMAITGAKKVCSRELIGQDHESPHHDSQLDTHRPSSVSVRKATFDANRRASMSPRLPKVKGVTEAGNQLSQQLQSRIHTSSSKTDNPHFSLGKRKSAAVSKLAPLVKSVDGNNVSLFKGKASADPAPPAFLHAKKLKVNPGIPTSVLQQHFELQNEKARAVVPPISSLFASEENIAIAVEQNARGSLDKPEVSEAGHDHDPFTFLNFILKYPETKEFVYLVSAATSTTYNPYNLKIVDFMSIDTKSPDGYYTMSAQGVTHINSSGQGTFTPIAQWKREYELYHQLLKIPFFSRYRKWKCFTLWKNTVLHAKIVAAKKNLTRNSFFLHGTLRKALLSLNNLNVDIVMKKRLVGFEDQKTLELAEFVKDQKHYVDSIVSNVLRPWEEQNREIVEKAVHKCLKDGGFELEETASEQEAKKLTFTEQAARRTECRRLSRFAKLCDYMMVTTLQYLTISSVQELLKSAYRGCQDQDVVIDDSGVGTVLIDAQGKVQPNSDPSSSSKLDLSAQSAYTGVQVGGVVVGRQVGTQNIFECGFDGFSDILSRIVVSGIQRIPLTEVIEDQGPMPEYDDDSNFEPKPAKKQDETKWKGGIEKTKIFVPLFRTELLMDDVSTKFYFASSVQDYLAAVDILLKIYLSTVEQVGQLTYTIKSLDMSSSGSTVRGLDEPEFGDGPQVGLIILEGGYFKELCGRIRGVFVGMFGNATAWLETLDTLQAMWLENQSFSGLASLKEKVGDLAFRLATSPESIEGGAAAIVTAAKEANDLLQPREEAPDKQPQPALPLNVLEYGCTASRDSDGLVYSVLVDFFDSSLKKYAAQKATMNAVPTRSVINNLLIDSANLKNILVPSPERCFNEVARLLPGLARNKNELLLTEIQTWVRILGTHPTSVEAFVEYLGWLEKIQDNLELVDLLESEVTQLYRILETHKIFIQPTDLAMYQTLSPTLRSLKESLDIAVDSKEDNIVKFTVDLEKLLTDLSAEVSEIRNSAQDPMVLNPSSNSSEVIKYLESLGLQLEKVDILKKKYEGWGKLFKSGGITKKKEGEEEQESQQAVVSDGTVEMEETIKEVELKNSLWNSLKDWDVLVDVWKTMPFDSLNTEEINTKLAQFQKVAYSLDKGLPPNDVVPKLKENVEQYRKMYSTIVDLRNPALKPRHWEKIQDSVGKTLTKDETFTLGNLIENHVFDFKEEIGLISSQAGSESALDEMLTRIIRLWNDSEFIVSPYRDSKDIFILGTVEDIQSLLEDSQVTIATIKSSRFIGPIKGEVERWDKMLNLFAETLDAWLICQRNWLYLESIFSAPDIQRQLPDEAKMFAQVDRSWKDIMRKVARNPNAMKSGTMPGVLETMQQNNVLLEQIQKCLEDYLESKRLLFPRFYFLSNDELLEILSQTKNPQAVQPHLSKCFDAIKSLEFAGNNDVKSIDIVGMNSPEGERVQFLKNIKARGNVEAWLGNVEEAMFSVLRRLIKGALSDYEEGKRTEWVREHVGQVVLTGNQVIWTRDVADALKSSDPAKALQAVKQKSISNLSGLAMLVRGDLSRIQRAILGALITIDVHNRDIIQGLINAKVSSPGDFEWTKQQRYYWDVESDTCHVKMSTSVFTYGYEYLGCSARLVITPLTDRCYLTLAGAMQLNLGGSPVGPAGTGKTETVKDLAKAMAKQCVVFNCSDGMDYKMMGKMFAGLAQSGAWCCFDEFNRIDIEVLSVIAQQLLTIKNAKDMKATRFIFEGRDIRLIDTCAAFITMNPGYAGRTELPDNLKALFRPIAMMIPDYGLIAEIMLFSEGFENAKVLAGKVVNLYKLCSEQLSQQDHYDFGMRAVKSVLIMAGALKRSAPELMEDVVLIRSLRDSNMPKFLSEDIGLFKGILSDLFPGVVVPERDFGTLVDAVKEVMDQKQLEIVDLFVSRICQLAETMRIRHGVMLVGPTGGGKTTCYETLQAALTNLREK